MENESEMIRQQMDETRAALTDKIETLEHQVVDTVQAASTAVSETVGSVKEIVHDSLQTVKDSVHDTVETVKDTFDIQRQVDRRPWTMFAGATALGFLGGYLLRGSNGREARITEKSESLAPSAKARTAVIRNGAPKRRDAAASTAIHESDAATTADKPSWVSNVGDTFHAEISQLEQLAVGTLLGIVRDIITEVVPEHMERQVEEIVNGITVKLGGQPLDGRILPERSRVEGFAKNGNKEDCG
jgi:ElaB/YqjD/DUF883 family membrane-anchored ribosome-binding protein